MKAAPPTESMGEPAHCQYGDQALHGVRLGGPTDILVESPLCQLWFLELTGVVPGTARKKTRAER
jgi:hypothetical protein